MTGDCHVPFRGSPGVRFPRATRQFLVAYRTFRRFLMTEPVEVRLVERPAWWNVHRTFMAIACARATCGPGEVPDELIHAASAAETQFIKAAREDLIKSGAVTQFVSEK